jgi:dCTP deaminase
MAEGAFSIEPLAGSDPSSAPFNASAIDLRLGNEVLIPKKNYPVAIDLRNPGIAGFLHQNSERKTIYDDQPYTLTKDQFVLTNTLERVAFPIREEGQQCYSARVEGKSSLARCGVLIHFTAPTIHAGFEGTITLEMINMSAHNFLLYPGMYICQLIIEEVRGLPISALNQFSGQTGPAGVVS